MTCDVLSCKCSFDHYSRIHVLETKINNRLEETNSLLRDFLSSKGVKRSRLQRETLVSQEEQEDSAEKHDKYSLIHEQQPRTQSPSNASPASRVMHFASKIMSRPRYQRSKQSTQESAQGSPKEYSELTTTLDYEELKSSTFSTDEEDTARDATSLRLTVLNRARSLQLPQSTEPLPERGVLRQTHSDSKETDFDISGGEGGRLESARSDSRV